MNNKEGKEESWKRGKKGMKNKEGKEAPWKRGKAKPEQRVKGWAMKWKWKISKVSAVSFWDFSKAFPFPLHWPSLFPLVQVWPSLSSMVLPFPLYCSSLSSLSFMVLPFPLYSSSLSSMISSPCRPGLAPGTSCGMMLKSFYRLPLPPPPVRCSSGIFENVCWGSEVQSHKGKQLWTQAIPFRKTRGAAGFWNQNAKSSLKNI